MFGQKNYNQIQGINGKYRINQIGCLLTAFCNVLTKNGMPADPLGLNAVFRDNRIYIDVDDGVRDDLGWQSVTAANGNLVVAQTGTSAVPPNANAIVRIKANNSFGTHFCAVERIEGGTVYVVDSWDGQVKNSNVYGPITGWATYRNIKPQPVQPVVAPPPPPPADTLTVAAGWGISHVARAAGYGDFGEPARWDYLARLNGHADHTSFRLFPGQVVRVHGDAPAPTPPPPPPAPAPAPTPEPPKAPEVVIVQTPSEPVATVTIPLPEAPTTTADAIDPEAWELTYKPDRKDYVAVEAATIKDLDGKQPNLPMKKGQRVHASGYFAKDGVVYARTVKSTENNWWYGIPMSILAADPANPPDDDSDIPDLDMALEAKEALHKLTSREKLVAAVAKTQGFLVRFLQTLHLKKK